MTPQLIRFNFLGMVSGLIGFFLALTPSLMPRPAALIGIIGGIGLALGYGAGVAASVLVRRYMLRTEPAQALKRRFWMILIALIPVVMIASSMLARFWQNEQLALLDQEPIAELSLFVIICLSVIVFAVLMLLGRCLRWLYHQTHRWVTKIPIPLPYIGSVITIGLIAIVVTESLTGLLERRIIVAIRASYGSSNNVIDPDYRQPTSPLKSGSATSESTWEGLGLQGRRFVAGGPTAEDIMAFTRKDANEPIRVYAGIENARDRSDRIKIVLRELERTNAFDRKILLVATPTGTGWIENETVSAFEFMHNGDTAIAAAQYSYLPSGFSFLIDRGEAVAMGRELLEAIEQRISLLPENDRPKIATYGLSLGSFGGQSAFAGEQDFSDRLDGALYVGTPGFSEPWRTLTNNRDAGSPQIKPIYNKEGVIKFATDTRDIPYEADADYRVVYFQYATDPFVWWNASLLYAKPDWMKEEPGRGVSSALRWVPILTFIQVSIDQAFSLSVTGDNGHDYSHDSVAAIAAATRPDDWSTHKSQALQQYINEHNSR